MSGSVLLYHMNDFAETIVDSSGNGNNGIYSGEALNNLSGKFNTSGIGFISGGAVDVINVIGNVTDFSSNF